MAATYVDDLEKFCTHTNNVTMFFDTHAHILQYEFEPNYDVQIYHDEHLLMLQANSDDEEEGSQNRSHDKLEELIWDAFGGDDTVLHVKVCQMQIIMLMNCS